MDDQTLPPVIDEAKLNEFGTRLFSLYATHKTDRKAAEDQWLKNLRQFRGLYDPEILAMIPSDRSKAYPKLTRWKVIGTVARLMQMLFPSTEKNYGIKPSPLPDLSVEQLQEVLNTLVTAAAEAQQIQPNQVVLNDADIEKAIYKYAEEKSIAMEKKLDDDLQEMEYITLARRVVFSAVLYNIGILEGPFHVKTKARVWEKDQFTGAYKAKEIEKYKPLFDFVPVWEWFPDMTAATLDKQDGAFRRRVMIREQIEALAERPDFLADRIKRWLADHQYGNYQAQWWETQLKGEAKGDRTYAQRENRKYEVVSYWGNTTGHELRAAGVTIPDADLGKTFYANSWMIDNIVIKARLASIKDVQQYHTFVFEEDDLSLLGNGQCDTLRDSQLSICETARALLDNMSVIGPMIELNVDLLTPGSNRTLKKHATFEREGTGAESQYPAVRDITIESHIAELIGLLKVFLDFSDKESGLPPPSMGDVSGGGSEALRTQQNASMFLGAAALPIRDTVRNFDTFTISAMNALVKWNMRYDPNPGRDGDHNVIARGSTSLIAKEVLSQSLDMFRATITPDEQPHLNTRKLLEARAKSRDIPIADILEDEEVAKQKIAAAAKAQEAQVALNEGLVRAQVEEILTNAMKNVALAKKADSSTTIDTFQAIIDALHGGLKLDNEAEKTQVMAAKPKAGAAK